VSPDSHPSAGALANTMLTAFNAAGDDLAYVSVDFPRPGQVQYNREADSATPKGAPARIVSHTRPPVRPAAGERS
jgi:hypothetical protein